MEEIKDARRLSCPLKGRFGCLSVSLHNHFELFFSEVIIFEIKLEEVTTKVSRIPMLIFTPHMPFSGMLQTFKTRISYISKIFNAPLIKF